MTVRSGRRHSEGFYRSLNALSTADMTSNTERTQRSKFFEVERVITHRIQSSKLQNSYTLTEKRTACVGLCAGLTGAFGALTSRLSKKYLGKGDGNMANAQEGQECMEVSRS